MSTETIIIYINIHKTRGEKTVSEIINDRARACYTVHQGACEQWTHGEPVEIWRDENRILCIRYEDGAWWHYSFKPTGLEWW